MRLDQVAEDLLIGVLTYDQLILILKNKNCSISNEDIALTALENWVAYNPTFYNNVCNFQLNKQSADNGVSFNQLVEIADNIIWAIVSLPRLLTLL